MAKHADNSQGIIDGFKIVFSAVSSNLGDGIQTNWRNLLRDKAFCAFLLASSASFAITSGTDFVKLSKERAKGENKMHKALLPKKEKKKKKDTRKYFWRDLKLLLKIILPSSSCRGVRLLITQFFLLVMRTLITVRMSNLCVYFLTRAIAQGSWRYWVRWLVCFQGWMVSGVVVNTGLKYLASQIELELRTRLTQHIHAQYLAANNFYKAAQGARQDEMDNPDQRIVSDVADFAAQATNLYDYSFTPALNFALSLVEASKDLGYARPFSMFGVTVLMNIGVRALSPSVGKMITTEQALEGEFRHAHSRLIAHSEEVAFLNGAEAERAILDRGLGWLSHTKGWNSLVKIRKDLLEQWFKFATLMMGATFVHIPFLVTDDMSDAQRISAFRSTEELMMRCGSAFGDVLLVGRKADELSGYMHRIIQFLNALDQEKKAHAAAQRTQQPPTDKNCLIEFEDVSVSAPEPDGASRCLVKHLNFQFIKGSSVLVTGPNGCGKTSLFRVVAGLWSQEEGVVRSGTKDIMWLPQRPYLVTGTLRDQVAYPRLLGFSTQQDEQIRECLSRAGIQSLASGPDGLSRIHAEWDDVLSGGERQRIGFARLYFQQPTVAVLDEATSAINPDEELTLYNEVLQGGCTVFSIAHRLELRRLHNWELKIKGDGVGNWELTKL